MRCKRVSVSIFCNPNKHHCSSIKCKGIHVSEYWCRIVLLHLITLTFTEPISKVILIGLLSLPSRILYQSILCVISFFNVYLSCILHHIIWSMIYFLLDKVVVVHFCIITNIWLYIYFSKAVKCHFIFFFFLLSTSQNSSTIFVRALLILNFQLITFFQFACGSNN